MMLNLKPAPWNVPLPEDGFARHVRACNNIRLPADRIPLWIGPGASGPAPACPASVDPALGGHASGGPGLVDPASVGPGLVDPASVDQEWTGAQRVGWMAPAIA